MAMDIARRTFIAFLGCALASRPILADAQQATRLRTIGVLMGLADDAETQARTKAFEHGLENEGWSLGKDVRIEYRFSGGDFRRMQAFANEFAQLKPDCILGHTTPVVEALVQATRTIPIVFVAVTDPIGSKFVTSIARPGGDATGFTIVQATITGKYLSILKEIIPQLARVAIIYNPNSVPGAGTFFLPPFIDAAREFKIEPITVQVHDPAEIESASRNSPASLTSALLSYRTTSSWSIVSCLSRSQRDTAFPRFIPIGISPRREACYPTGWTPWTSSGAPRGMSAASSEVRSRRTFPSRRRRNSNS